MGLWGVLHWSLEFRTLRADLSRMTHFRIICKISSHLEVPRGLKMYSFLLAGDVMNSSCHFSQVGNDTIDIHIINMY